MIAKLNSMLALIGLATVLYLWKTWFPQSWVSFWSAVYGMIV